MSAASWVRVGPRRVGYRARCVMGPSVCESMWGSVYNLTGGVALSANRVVRLHTCVRGTCKGYV